MIVCRLGFAVPLVDSRTVAAANGEWASDGISEMAEWLAEAMATASSHAVRHDMAAQALEEREVHVDHGWAWSVLPLGINVGIGLPGLLATTSIGRLGHVVSSAAL